MANFQLNNQGTSFATGMNNFDAYLNQNSTTPTPTGDANFFMGAGGPTSLGGQLLNSRLSVGTINGQDYNAAGGFIPTDNTDANQKTGTTTPRVDPYAKYGGQAAFDNLRSGFDAQRQGIHSTSGEAAASAGTSLGNSITDYVNSLRSGQRQMDESGVQNELARSQGSQGVLNMVGRGIRSGGVMLNNKNASNSSGAEGIANAYAQIGRGQQSNINNQYELGNRENQMQQANFDEQDAAGANRILGSKAEVVNNIVAEARSKFAALDAAMQDASMPDRIAIEQEKETIRAQATAALQQYDGQLQQGRDSVTATTGDQRRTEANRLAGLGQVSADAFQYSTQAPSQFAGTGPSSSDIPLFTMPRGRRAA